MPCALCPVDFPEFTGTNIYEKGADGEPLHLFGLNLAVACLRNILVREGINADIQIMNASGHNVWTDALRK